MEAADQAKGSGSGYGCGSGSGSGSGYGSGYGDGYGYGSGYGDGYGYGSGYGSGYGYGSGSGSGYGDGYGYGSGSGSGYGDGDGYGYGYGYGYGSGSGSGYGDGYGYGSGSGSGYGDGDGYGGSLEPPAWGSFVCWKKASSPKKVSERLLVKLEVPADAKRILGADEASSGKCRASKARVLEITSLDGLTQHQVAVSSYDGVLPYRVGDLVEPKEGFDEADVACSTGIHFFMRREAALEY
jgi:hypothetical protein